MTKKQTKKKIKFNELNDNIYEEKISLIKLIPLIVIIATIALISNLPSKQLVINIVKDSMAANKDCPIATNKIDLSFFLVPKLILDRPIVPRSCFKGKQDLQLNKITASLGGLQFYRQA